MKVDWEVAVSDNLKNKISSLANDIPLMTQIHMQFRAMCTPYVPYLEGVLSDTTEVTHEYVRWSQPYAHYQYVGISPNGKAFNYTKEQHPLATSQWDKAMMRDVGDDFTQRVQELVNWRASQLL